MVWVFFKLGLELMSFFASLYLDLMLAKESRGLVKMPLSSTLILLRSWLLTSIEALPVYSGWKFW